MNRHKDSFREGMSRAPNCLKCACFKITWEPAFPHSCSAFGIKCRGQPSLEVYKSTGAHCPAFTVKEK